LENGLIILSCGVYGNVLRILVPITADPKEIEEGIEILKKSTLQVLNR
jgi:4-aminobutyrate aminotransferase-like enzyme